MQSAFVTVDSRWATTIVVRSRHTALSAFCGVEGERSWVKCHFWGQNPPSDRYGKHIVSRLCESRVWLPLIASTHFTQPIHKVNVVNDTKCYICFDRIHIFALYPSAIPESVVQIGWPMHIGVHLATKQNFPQNGLVLNQSPFRRILSWCYLWLLLMMLGYIQYFGVSYFPICVKFTRFVHCSTPACILNPSTVHNIVSSFTDFFVTQSTPSVRSSFWNVCAIPIQIQHNKVTFSTRVMKTVWKTWMFLSVRVSSAEVASSSRTIRGALSSVLAMATLCFSPPDSFNPRSPTFIFITFNRIVWDTNHPYPILTIFTLMMIW